MKNAKKEFEIEAKKSKISGVKPQQTLEEAQKKTVMKLFAEIEMKRRDVEKRKRKQEQREHDQEVAENEKLKKEVEFEKNWKGGDRLNNRVGNWRNFQVRPKKKGR